MRRVETDTEIGSQLGTLESMQVGIPHRYDTPDPNGRESDRPGGSWETSFVRTPSPQSRRLYTTHLEGNAQADTKNHGRPDQAVLLYAATHYERWRQELQRVDIGPGGFGENFTMSGFSEGTACIGDVHGLGEARIQVTGPRYPCWKIERRWQIAGLTARVSQTGRTGWYCRVLEEGLIEPGMPVLLLDRPYPRLTVALVNDIGHGRNRDPDMAGAAAACPLLNEFWQKLTRRSIRREQ